MGGVGVWLGVLGALAGGVVGVEGAVAGRASRAGLASTTPYRGVNLGGWLVLESWITPSVYSNNSVPSGVGEWQLCEQLGPTKAASVLTAHWSSWVSQSQIQTLVASGFTHFRIPLGFWILGDVAPGEPYVVGGLPFLQRALQWIHAAGGYAVLDAHGVPGSQNGHDNSGSVGWINFTQPAYYNRTVSFLQSLASFAVEVNGQASTQGVVVGLDLINEPWTPCVNGPVPVSLLVDFYSTVIPLVRATGFDGDLWLSDGFCVTDSAWDAFYGLPNVYMTSHLYHAFGGIYSAMGPWQNVNYTCSVDAITISQRTQAPPTVVGEYSLAITNGNPNDPPTVDQAAWLRQFAYAQIAAYDGSALGNAPGASVAKGSFFWNFNIEQGYSPWNALEGIARGYIPNANSSSWGDFGYQCNQTFAL
jgi:glucan 1,3-beta-glucosidase